MKAMPYYVIVKPQLEEKTEAGLYMPESKDKKPERGVVVDVGGVKKPIEKPMFNKGDKVIYKKWAAHPVKHKGESYEFMRHQDVMAVI